MHTIHVKHNYSIILFLIVLLVPIELKSQEKFDVYARMGINRLYLGAYANINNHEAYILGNEIDLDQPLFYGLDIKFKLNSNWVIGTQINFVEKHRQNFYNITNRYVFSHNQNIQELVEYSFAPILVDLSVGRSFSLFKKFLITPQSGLGLRFINKKGYETTYSNGTQNLNQLELANIAFNQSFNKVDGFWLIGLNLSYSRFYIDMSLRYSLSESLANDFKFEDKLQPNEVTQNSVSFGLGYKIWTQY